jgi:serine/threonine protein kinase/Tfp pilus assembly protein PilF
MLHPGDPTFDSPSIEEFDMVQPAIHHWETVKRLHQFALDKDPSDRTAFVTESCGGDEAVLREVQSLLLCDADAETFLEQPAIDMVPKSSSDPQDNTLVGRRLSHYQVLSLLGAGGMGEVYLAHDPRLDRMVALKILPGDLAGDPDRMQRFAREARAASALNHPNVATIHDVGESDGIHFIVMERVEGETIATSIEGRPLSPSEVIDIAVQVADALDVAHAKGITHRDIKPANLMLTHRGHVKVLDFGIAKTTRGDERAPNDDWTVEPRTAVGSVIGSGPYMSPEQIAGGHVDPRSDVFSLGIVIYQIATRRLPFSGATREELMERILHAAPEPITGIHADIPPELERITFKCLEKSAGDRYQSARQLLTDLWPLKRRLDATRATQDSARFDLLTRPDSTHAVNRTERAMGDEMSISGASQTSEASELVARGFAHLRSGSFFELSDAVSAFLAATRMDPTYAAAHAGLALAKVAQATVRAVPYLEALDEAKTIALRALALDDKSADAQVALGQVMFFGEWDWIAAERSFQRALALNPNHAEAYLHYGGLVEALGDLPRGLELKLQGLECDSTSALAHVLIAVSFWNQRRYDDVIVWLNKALDRDPQHLFARELLAGTYVMKGDWERAFEQDLKRVEARGPSEETLAAVKGIQAEILQVYHQDGAAAAWRCILKHRQRAVDLVSDGAPPQDRGAQEPRGNANLAIVTLYAEAGDLDTAFAYLQRAIDVRDPALVHLAVAPQWDSLRGDPRFNECLARMKLPRARS